MKIFLSHVSLEGPLAITLKEWVETSFAGQFEIFVSSDINDLPAGNQWLTSLEKALADAGMLIVLCSPFSVTRPWVNFETGGAWVKQIPIIPICHSGQSKSALPAPLSFFQGLEVNSPTFVSDLLHSLSKPLKLRRSPPIDKTRMMEDIHSALNRITLPTQPNDSRRVVQKPRPRPAGAGSRKNGNLLRRIATASNEACTCSKLAKSLHIPQNELDVHLRYLMDRNYIKKMSAKGKDCWYTTTSKGRTYLVKQGLL
ncbi:MAG: toll/interleukin-1 receptor domain-containing protein [Chloroflexi bacterium]|nr:toll/interleukin-1 receptor domain-containing protein [Chloroflexota bacterium]